MYICIYIRRERDIVLQGAGQGGRLACSPRASPPAGGKRRDMYIYIYIERERYTYI